MQLNKAASWRFVALLVAALVTTVAAALFVSFTSAAEIDALIESMFGSVLHVTQNHLGMEWRIVIVTAVKVLTAVLPLTIVFIVATRTCLRDVAYNATLIVVNARPSGRI